MEPNNLLTIGEAHRAARISQRTLYRLINDSAIRAVKLGHRTFVPRAEIDRFLAELPAYQPASA